MKISTDRFVSIGCKNKDLQSGTEVVQWDKLSVGLPIVLLQTNGKDTKQIDLNTARNNQNRYSSGSPYENKIPLVLNGSDFQTKSITF
jgi:hypothetical protein